MAASAANASLLHTFTRHSSHYLRRNLLQPRWEHSQKVACAFRSTLANRSAAEDSADLSKLTLDSPASSSSYVVQSESQEESLFHDFRFALTAPKPQAVEDRFRLVEEAAEPPLALVFGWAGATTRNLAKYAQIYQRAGCTTLTYILPTRFIFDVTADVPYLAQRLIRVLEVEGLLNRPVFVHSMSDTGLMCYQGLQTVASERNLNLDIRAFVMDSCPGPRPNVTLPRLAALAGVRFICGVRDGLTINQAAYNTYRMLRDRTFPNYLRKLRGESFELSEMGGVWAGDYMSLDAEVSRRHPELFLYSKSDFYLPWTYLEHRVLPRRRQAGRAVRTKCWERSPHVGHLRANGDDYVRAVHDFLDEAYFAEKREQLG